MCVALFATVTARADTADEASRLFTEGFALQKAGKYTEACAKFVQSYDLDRKASRPAPGTQLNLGDCAEREGQFHKAYLLFDDAFHEYDRRIKEAQAQLAKDPASADAKRELDRAVAGKRVAREHADALAPKLAKVVVRIAEPGLAGLAVRVGDRAVPAAAEIVDYRDAGPVTITATAPGRKTFTTSTEAVAGKQVVVEVSLGTTGGSDRPDDVPGSGKRKTRIRLAYGLGIGGVVLLGISGSFGLAANSQYDKAAKNCVNIGGKLMCPQSAADDIDKAGTKADVATVLGIGGVLLVGGAAVLYFTAPREVAVVPMASASSAGVSVVGRF